MLGRIRQLNVYRSKSFRILLFLFCIPVLFCIVKILQPNQSYTYSGRTSFDEGTPSLDTVIYDHLALKPGVYRIRLAYSTDMDAQAVCRLQDDTVLDGGLLTNGEHLYSALDCTGYEAWLFERTEGLQVVIDFYGGGELTTGELVVVETNLLWKRFLICLLFLLAVSMGILIYCFYQKQYGVSAGKKQVFFFLLLISFLSSLPYLQRGMVSGADLSYHLQRIEGVKDGLLGGQFPVRIEPRWVYDHGYADAIFYCNTLLFFPALLRMAGFTVIESYAVYCIALNIATTLIAYYCFSRIYESDTIGLCCSALYTLSIFRIYKLTITSAVGEGSAFTFLPLIIYGFYRVFTEDTHTKQYKTAWIPLCIGYAGLIQTHVLTCEVTVLLTVLLCLICILKIARPAVFWELAKAALAALGVSLWYLVPFADFYLTQDMQIKHASARTIQDRGLLPGQLGMQFWKAGSNTPLGDNGMQYSHPVGIGLTLLFGLALFWILQFGGAFRKLRERQKALAIVSAVLGSLLLLLSLNSFPWDRIQRLGDGAAALVSSLQFPNRFLGWGTACLVTVCGFCLWHFRDRELSFYRMGIVITAVGILTSGLHLLDYVTWDQQHLDLYNEESMGFGYISGAEYLIYGTDERALSFERPAASPGVSLSDYQKNYLHVEMTCANEGEDTGTVTLPLLAYKGYQAWDEESGAALMLGESDRKTLRLQIPAGYSGRVVVDFVPPICWRVSELVSLLTVLGLAAAKGIRRRRA